jgi:hypothetical protein
MATYETTKYRIIPINSEQIADESITNTEFQRLNGVTGDIQTQIGNLDTSKLPKAGGTITGNITTTDNNHLYIGTGQDIDVFSDGSTGFIKSNDIRIQSSTGENYITGAANGATKLFHDNVQKAETTGSGLTVSGAMAATTVTGNGSALTNLNASNASSGTLPMARLSGTLPALNGSALTNLNGSNVSSGTLPMARLSGTLPALNGSSLTNLNASNASSGTLPMARLSGTLPALNGSSLTNLNGSNISSGTVADARISTLTASKLTGALPAIDGSALTGIDTVPSSSTAVGTIKYFALYYKGSGNNPNTSIGFGTEVTPASYDVNGKYLSSSVEYNNSASSSGPQDVSRLGYLVPGFAVASGTLSGKTRATEAGTWRCISSPVYSSFTTSGNSGGSYTISGGGLFQRVS